MDIIKGHINMIYMLLQIIPGVQLGVIIMHILKMEVRWYNFNDTQVTKLTNRDIK